MRITKWERPIWQGYIFNYLNYITLEEEKLQGQWNIRSFQGLEGGKNKLSGT